MTGSSLFPSESRRNRRSAVLEEALKLSSTEGLEGLTIGRLANRSGLSKAGVFSHFGSKTDLQIATLEVARSVYLQHVVEPAMQIGPGLRRVRGLLEAWLNYLQDDVFPGGCFLLAASYEWDNRPGRLRDVVVTIMTDLDKFLLTAVTEAADAGDIDEISPARLAFELHAIVSHANLQYQLFRDPRVFEMAREIIYQRLTPSQTSTSRRSLP